MRRPDLIPNTRLAHEATEFAVEHGKTWEVHRALFRAYFEEERNLGDIAVVCEACESIGLDPAAVRAALEAGTYTAEVERQREWCRSIGVTGVPTVVFEERFALVGAQDYEAVRDIARRVLTRPVAEG
jgi:predicted DsbA family dithiol-disulfide isomerase